MKKYLPFILMTLLLSALAYVYMYPGSQAMLEHRTDVFLSDGTDPTTLPGAYDMVLQTWKSNPQNFLYGAVYTDKGDPQRGSSFWMPWNERFLVVFLANFFPVEQIYPAFVFVLFLLNGLCMFLLGEYLRWPKAVTVALSVAWAFNAFTRARAKVHGAMAGVYHIPLIFLGCYLVVRGKTWRSLSAAAACFFVAATVAHYFLVTWVFLSPFILIFIFTQLEKKSDWKRVYGRLAIAAMPALLMMGFNFLYPLPPGAKQSTNESLAIYVKPGETDPFLYRFPAWPIDYFAGDIAIEEKPDDLNPLRELVNEYILENLSDSNSHERTNGIRWSIWILTLAAAWSLFKKSGDKKYNRTLAFFFAFAAFTFWLSLTPNATLIGEGPSAWLYKMFPKVRVASRAGINVHFALLMIVGIFLATPKVLPKFKKYLLLPGVLLALMIVDFFPVQKMPLAPIAPAFAHLAREKGECGAGMHFPYISSLSGGLLEYVFAQRLRGSDCLSLSRTMDLEMVKRLHSAFPPEEGYIRKLMTGPEEAERLIRFAQCVPLNWIVFHPAVPQMWSADVCRRLGWVLHDDLTCVGAERNKPFVNSPEKCL